MKHRESINYKERSESILKQRRESEINSKPSMLDAVSQALREETKR